MAVRMILTKHMKLPLLSSYLYMLQSRWLNGILIELYRVNIEYRSRQRNNYRHSKKDNGYEYNLRGLMNPNIFSSRRHCASWRTHFPFAEHMPLNNLHYHSIKFSILLHFCKLCLISNIPLRNLDSFTWKMINPNLGSHRAKRKKIYIFFIFFLSAKVS